MVPAARAAATRAVQRWARGRQCRRSGGGDEPREALPGPLGRFRNGWRPDFLQPIRFRLHQRNSSRRYPREIRNRSSEYILNSISHQSLTLVSRSRKNFWACSMLIFNNYCEETCHVVQARTLQISTRVFNLPWRPHFLYPSFASRAQGLKLPRIRLSTDLES